MVCCQHQGHQPEGWSPGGDSPRAALHEDTLLIGKRSWSTHHRRQLMSSVPKRFERFCRNKAMRLSKPLSLSPLGKPTSRTGWLRTRLDLRRHRTALSWARAEVWEVDLAWRDRPVQIQLPDSRRRRHRYRSPQSGSCRTLMAGAAGSWSKPAFKRRPRRPSRGSRAPSRQVGPNAESDRCPRTSAAGPTGRLPVRVRLGAAAAGGHGGPSRW